MSRVFVTGATGFVGRHLCEALAAGGHEVKSLIRPGHPATEALARVSSPVIGQLLEPPTYEAAMRGCDAVIHAAGISSAADPREFETVNTQGTAAVVDACRRSGAGRLIFFSSIAVLWPPNAYGESKRRAEALIARSGVRATILRPAQIYGPRDRSGVGRLISLVRRSPVILIPGDGRNTMQPVAVADVARFLLAILKSGQGEGQTYALAGPEPVTFIEFVRLVERLLGVRRFHLHVPLAGLRAAVRVQEACLGRAALTADQVNRMAFSTAVDCAPARALGFAPRPLEQRLREALAAGFP